LKAFGLKIEIEEEHLMKILEILKRHMPLLIFVFDEKLKRLEIEEAYA